MTVVVIAALVLLAAVYLWSWSWSGRAAPRAVSPARVIAFLAGVVTLGVAVASPLAHMDHGHLTAHMIQHLLIMTVAAPLLLLGEPFFVLRLGNRPGRRAVRPWSPSLVLCWCAGTLVVLVWHVPAVFELGMRWHPLQHATFLVGGLLFWLPVVEPYPTAFRGSRWWMPLYLFLATMPCDALSAFLTFCGRVVYPHYGQSPAALDDQVCAGALMWFWVTIAYLVPAAIVTVQILSSSKSRLRSRSSGDQGTLLNSWSSTDASPRVRPDDD
jgi:cytochrome c oxidase assembly factor CtaG